MSLFIKICILAITSLLLKPASLNHWHIICYFISNIGKLPISKDTVIKTKKLLQDCPNCSYQFKAVDYIAKSAICRDCHKSFPKLISPPNLLYRYRKHFVAISLILGALNFSFLVYKNRGRFTKKDTAISSYIKHYWDNFKGEHLISIIQDCIKKNDFQCQMLAYKKLTELNPNNHFYQKSYKAKLKKFKNPPRLDFFIR